MKEELRQKYEDFSWNSATRIIEAFVDAGKIIEAKQQARDALNNWEMEGKIEIINEFKEWLKGKNINLD